MIAAAEQIRDMVSDSVESLRDTTCDHKSPRTHEVLQSTASTAVSQAVLSSAQVWKLTELWGADP